MFYNVTTWKVEIKIPVTLSAETWATVIEQFLMLILIIGRWLLPKGDLTREQLSQLLLVYIGTAADIIEFFDSFKVLRFCFLAYRMINICRAYVAWENRNIPKVAPSSEIETSKYASSFDTVIKISSSVLKYFY